MTLRILVCEDWPPTPFIAAPAHHHWRHRSHVRHHHHAGLPPCHHVHLRCHWEGVGEGGGGGFGSWYGPALFTGATVYVGDPIAPYAGAIPGPSTWLLFAIAFVAVIIFKRGRTTHV